MNIDRLLARLALIAVALCVAGSDVLASTTTIALWEFDDPAQGADAAVGPNPLAADVGSFSLNRQGSPYYSFNTAPRFAPGSSSNTSRSMYSAGGGTLYYRDGAIPLGGASGTNFGIEIWAYPTAAPLETEPRYLLSWGQNSGQTRGLQLILSDVGGSYYYNVNYLGSPGPGIIFANASGNLATLNEWTHLAVVRDDSPTPVTSFYVNGSLIGTSTDPFVNPLASDRLILPSNLSGAKWGMAGNLDYLRFFTFDSGQFDPTSDLATVPEPSSLILLGMGAAAFFLGTRRRRRAVSAAI